MYGNLSQISNVYLITSRTISPLQYKIFASCPVAINRMFAMHHAQFPKLEQNHIVRILVVGASKLQLLFVTVAFGIGLMC